MRGFKKHSFDFMTGWLILSVFVITAAFLKDGPFPGWGYYWIAMTVVMFFPLLVSYQITSLTIDRARDVVIIEWQKWITLRKVEEYPIRDVRVEIVSRTSRSLVKYNVYCVYERNRLLSQMTWFSGWDKNTVTAFITELTV